MKPKIKNTLSLLLEDQALPCPSMRPNEFANRLSLDTKENSIVCNEQSVQMVTTMEDYSVLSNVQPDELLDCRIHQKQVEIVSSEYSVKSDFITENDHESWLEKNKTIDDHVQETYFIKVRKKLTEVVKGRKEIVCFKCQHCSYIAMSQRLLLVHNQRGSCSGELVPLRCPGCPNIFYNNTPLRVHLQHDHGLGPRDIKTIMYNLNRVRVVPGEMQNNWSCVYNSIKPVQLNESNDMCDERPSCASDKRTFLESYLDVSPSKDCGIPSQSQNGQDILENTFNFTAPVSEQLPSIQPENTEAEPTNTRLDDVNNDPSALLEESAKLNMPNPSLVEPTTTNGIPIQLISHRIVNPNRSPSHNYITFANEEVFEEESLNEYAYIDGEIPVTDLVVDKSESSCPLPQSAVDEKNSTNARKIGCGYRCNINGCKLRMQNEDNIKYHRRCHEGQLYNCPECCKDCPNWISLSSHLWQKHKIDMELFKCDVCPYRTPSYSRLTSIHRGIHSNEKPFLCDVCGKGFKTVKQMRNHKVIHRAKMVRPSSSTECNICWQKFANRRALAQHIRTVHKKIKPFLCSVCGFSSATKHSLIVHMRIHTGEKPHKCSKCDYSTADHNAMRRHLMKHAGASNYKCPQCSYTTIQATCFKMHIKQKHPGLEQDVIFSCQHCRFETLQRSKYIVHTAIHNSWPNEKGVPESEPSTADSASGISVVVPVNAAPQTYYAQETIVDLSSAQLLGEEYYVVNEISDGSL